jgi:8-oxo-dGTP pyrophosphatase MutT (NUDIX family)
MRTIKRDIVGAFLFSSDDQLLIGKSVKGGVYKDTWIIPGGGIKEGETALQAVHRETLEETGIDISDAVITSIEGELSGSSEKTLRETGETVMVDMTFFNFRIQLPHKAADIVVKTEDDFTDAQWVPLADLPTYQLSPPTITTLRRAGVLA